jgi:hypothetical protein
VFRNIEREIRESEEELKVLLIERFNAEKRKAAIEQQYKKYKEDNSKRSASSAKTSLKSTKDFEIKPTTSRELTDHSVTGLQLK